MGGSYPCLVERWEDMPSICCQDSGRAEKKIKDLGAKLTKANKEGKSAEATLADVEKQAEDQRQQLRKAEEQLAIARE